jgi:hypothetical protein
VVTRRNFLASASAAIIYAPPVVPAANLMPLRGTVFPLAPHFVIPPAPAVLQFGFCQRLAVGLHLPHITQLQNERLPLHQIASELNRRGPKPWKD